MANLWEGVDFGDNVDTSTFEQIMDMDDEDDGSHEFSRSIVFGFFEQAESTFEKMNSALAARDLEELSSLGHFLKGSSATLGYTKVKDECEKIQHLGKKKDETGTVDEPDDSKSLRLIKECVNRATRAFDTVKLLMETYYERLEG